MVFNRSFSKEISEIIIQEEGKQNWSQLYTIFILQNNKRLSKTQIVKLIYTNKMNELTDGIRVSCHLPWILATTRLVYEK